MQWLKQSTAASIMLGPFVDETNGYSPETGLTIAQADIRLSKNGGVFAQKNDATAASQAEFGWYNVEIDATDTGTLGRLTMAASSSGALPCWREFMVVEPDAYDAYYAAAGTGHVECDAVQISGDTTAANNAESFFDGTGYAGTNNVIPTVTTLTGHTAQTGDSYAQIGTAGSVLTAIPWNAAWDAEVESEVTDSLEAHNLDHLALTATAGADMTTEVADNTILSRILANGDTSAFVPSTDGLQLIRDKLTDIETDTAEIGTAGAGLTDLGGMSTAMLAEVEAEVADALDAAIPGTPTQNSLNDVIQSISPAFGTSDSVGTTTTLIDSGRSEIDDYFNGLTLTITSGAAAGQSRTISDFANATGTFTVNKAFSDAIASGITYRIISTQVYQPGIVVTQTYPHNVEPDTNAIMNLSIVTNNGAPVVGDITAGTILFNRIRAGSKTFISGGLACTKATGQIYYSYDFPPASWQAGDEFEGYMTGQKVIVNGIEYDLAPITFPGRVTREAVIAIDVAGLDGDAMRGTDGANTTVPDAAGTAAALHVTTDAAIAALNDPTAATIADAVWNELATGHTDAGKAGQQLWTDVDAILADTNELQTDDIPTLIAALPTAAENRAEMDSNSTQLSAIVTDTNELQTDNVPGLIAALNDISVTDITQRQIPDSVPADGVLPTIEQAIYMINQFLMERAVSSTTVTVKKVDGSTSLMTFTLDDADDPTSITRAT